MVVKNRDFLALTPVTTILWAGNSKFSNQFSNFQQLPRKKEGNIKKISFVLPRVFQYFLP
jgi:hypothetical protein